MSGTCGNCDCPDQSQCVKKGNAPDIIETYNSRMEVEMGWDAPVMEHNDKCKCGPACKCTDCTCGP